MGYLVCFFTGMIVGVTLITIWALLGSEDNDG